MMQELLEEDWSFESLDSEETKLQKQIRQKAAQIFSPLPPKPSKYKYSRLKISANQKKRLEKASLRSSLPPLKDSTPLIKASRTRIKSKPPLPTLTTIKFVRVRSELCLTKPSKLNPSHYVLKGSKKEIKPSYELKNLTRSSRKKTKEVGINIDENKFTQNLTNDYPKKTKDVSINIRVNIPTFNF